MGVRTILVIFVLFCIIVGVVWYKPSPSRVKIHRRFVYDNLVLPAGSRYLSKEFRSHSSHKSSMNSILEIFASTSETGTCILDIGCHVGDTTIKMAAGAADGVNIIAVDSDADRIAFVDAVIRLNQIDTVHTRLVSIPNVIDGIGAVPSLIHVDIGEHEMRIFRGLESTIRLHRPTIMVEIEDAAAIRTFLDPLGYECIWSSSSEQAYLFIPKFQYHIVVVCTPNYNPIGAYGVNSLKAYADRHGYEFTLHATPIDNGLHLNYTKNAAVLEVMKTSKTDFVVSVDADIEIMDPTKTLGSLLWCTGTNRETTAFRAPEDRFTIPWSKQSSLNAGFIMWSNTRRAQDINQRWLDLALGECKHWACQKPYQQNVFRHCLEPELRPTDRAFLDYREVGMLYSSFIRQTRQGIRGWRRMGSPNNPIDCHNM